MNHRTKFRPYFTAEQMLELISALKENPKPARISLIQYLESFNLKIQHGLVEPSIITKPSLAESMGLDDPLISTQSKPINPDIRRSKAYAKWTLNPSECTPYELKDVNEYRYTHGLFSPEEQMAFEKSIGISLE